MINRIIGAISTALDAEFGGQYRIYMEEKEQDLEGPCFFIQCLNPEGEHFRGNRYIRRCQFCIQYFPESKSGSNQECQDVAERMSSALEYIRMGILLRGIKRNYRIVDGVLNYFVSYHLFDCRNGDSVPVMEELVSGRNMKGGLNLKEMKRDTEVMEEDLTEAEKALPGEEHAGKADEKAKESGENSAPRYTKQQLAASAGFRNQRDLVSALLEEGQRYTVSEADRIVREFMKGRVE